MCFSKNTNAFIKDFIIKFLNILVSQLIDAVAISYLIDNSVAAFNWIN